MDQPKLCKCLLCVKFKEMFCLVRSIRVHIVHYHNEIWVFESHVKWTHGYKRNNKE